uniref:LRAT domain-containing protein n=1 Tax=Xenopus tropicalis TaxID=8364 RepID=A0A1B8Y5V6_XENTR
MMNCLLHNSDMEWPVQMRILLLTPERYFVFYSKARNTGVFIQETALWFISTEEVPLTQLKGVRVINKYDQKLKPKKQGDVAIEAKQKIGERMTWGEKNDTDQLFVTELRYGVKVSDKRPLPEVGDLIEFLQDAKNHWAVYVGDGKAVHRAEHGLVEEDYTGRIAGGHSYRVNNKFDRKLKPRSSTLVVKDVCRQLGKRCAEDSDELFATQLRYGIACSDERPIPEAGDLIEFLRHVKNHWGVYVGDGKVVHRTEFGLVEEDYIGRIAGGRSYRVNNKFDRKLKPRSIALAMTDVRGQLGRRCAEDSDELFVTHLRYGIACSDENPPPDAGEILCYSFQNKEHWGIYTGESTVVYLDRGLQEGFPEPSETAYVQEVPLTQLKGIKVINKYDQMLKPKKQVDIAIEAKQRIGEKVTWGEDDDTDQLFLTELRYGMKVSNKQPPPEPGDLIEFVRLWGAYSHWGVYVGDGNLVHLQHGKVLEQSVASVAKGSKYRVNNSYDKYYEPRRKDVIVAMAKQHVGQKMTYNLCKSNCEHFATLMRYGVAFSKQVEESRVAHLFCKQNGRCYCDIEAFPPNDPTLHLLQQNAGLPSLQPMCPSGLLTPQNSSAQRLY